MFDLEKEYTIGELYRPAMSIEDEQEAAEYFEALVRHNMAKWGSTLEDAQKTERSNLGYFSGYYNAETMERVNRLFGTTHPIFGNVVPSPKEAFEMGQKLMENKQ